MAKVRAEEYDPDGASGRMEVDNLEARQTPRVGLRTGREQSKGSCQLERLLYGFDAACFDHLAFDGLEWRGRIG